VSAPRPRRTARWGLQLRTAFSLTLDMPRSSRYTAHPRHAAIFVLADASAASTWRPSEGDRCSGRWHEAAIEQQALGACVDSLQGHVISPSLHGWHLSRSLRTFLARLVVLSSSSGLDVRAAAHIQRCGQTPRRYGVYPRCCSTAYHGSAAPTGPWRGTIAVLGQQMTW
jgi:hypothetical protein